MKITLANGTIIELQDGEDISSIAPLITGAPTATVAAAPVPAAPTVIATTPAYAPVEEFIKGMEAEEAASPRARRPGKVYLTEREDRALSLLREFPNEGLTTAQIAELTGLEPAIASAMLSNLRFHRPGQDTNTPLITKVSKGVYRVTPLGMRLKTVVNGRPAPENRKLGWEDE